MRIEVGLTEDVSGDYEIAIYTDETTEKDWQLYLGMPKMSIDEYDSWTVLLKEVCPMPIMQNSEAEYVEHQWLWDNATGDVLVGGLGIGFINQSLVDNPNVTSVCPPIKDTLSSRAALSNCPNKSSTYSSI